MAPRPRPAADAGPPAGVQGERGIVMNGFEGSYLGNSAKLPAAARLECKICWWVYDPALGDPVWQIEPGTAFGDLPAHWRCPQCDGDAEQFMVLADQ